MSSEEIPLCSVPSSSSHKASGFAGTLNCPLRWIPAGVPAARGAYWYRFLYYTILQYFLAYYKALVKSTEFNPGST